MRVRRVQIAEKQVSLDAMPLKCMPPPF